MVQKKRKSKRQCLKKRGCKLFKSQQKKERRVPMSVLRTDESVAALVKIREMENRRNKDAVCETAERPVLVNSRDPVMVDGDVYMDNNSPVTGLWKAKLGAKDFDPTKKYDIVKTPYTLILNGRVPGKEKTFEVLREMLSFIPHEDVCLHFCIPRFKDVDEFVEVFGEEYGLNGWREVAGKIFDEFLKGIVYFYRGMDGVMNFQIK